MTTSAQRKVGILALAHAGIPYREIGRALGVSGNYAHEVAAKAGIVRNPKMAHFRPERVAATQALRRTLIVADMRLRANRLLKEADAIEAEGKAEATA